MKGSVWVHWLIGPVVLAIALVLLTAPFTGADDLFLSYTCHEQPAATGFFTADFGTLDSSAGIDFAMPGTTYTYLYFNSGYGAFIPNDTLDDISQLSLVEDVDGDGYGDLIQFIGINVQLWKNNTGGQPGAFSSTVTTLPASPSCWRQPNKFAEFGDIDDDGDLDCARWDYDCGYVTFLLYNSGTGYLDADTGNGCVFVRYCCTDGPEDGTLVDIDGDDDLDVVTANGQYIDVMPDDTSWISIFTNDGDGGITISDSIMGDTSGTYNTYARRITSGLFDGDGYPDLVVSRWESETTDSLIFYSGDGSGGFGYDVACTSNGTAWLELVDLNGDDDADIIDLGSKTAVIHYGDGSGGIEATEVVKPSGSDFGNAYYVQYADADGDTDIDLLVSDSDSLTNMNRAWVFYNHTYVDSSQGDCDSNNVIDVWDLVYLSLYLEGKGPAPKPWYSGDCDFNGVTDADDVTYLSNYIFSSGPRPLVH